MEPRRPPGTNRQGVVVPAMAATITATSWPAATSRLTVARHIADAVDVGDRVPPNFMTRRAMLA